VIDDDNDHDHVDGWDYVAELLPPTGLLFAYISMDSHGRITMSTEENWFFHKSSLAIVPAESLGSKQKKWAKEMRI
jgi:hypothetical protein